ncbi:hypothetical protein [Bradyrhizobium sp. I1.7.5]|uniref:hypothetical protein n=1 Tax=Bradyrhizobium sp. I1.7.5 TaxID=3156363 RepID=UPI003397C0AE
MIGRELKAEMARLAQRHNARPIARPKLPLLSHVNGSQIVEGIAASPDVDFEKMSFRAGSLSWDTPLPPLLISHNRNRVAGKILALDYDDRGILRIRARVDDHEARRFGGFSIAATVHEAETRNADSFLFHAVITRATVDEVSLTDRPCNSSALVVSRRDVTARDDRHDEAIAGALRCQALIEQLKASWSSPAIAKSVEPEIDDPPDEPPSLDASNLSPARHLNIGPAPPLILGRLPAAIVEPKRNQFRNLVARLPTGD